MENLQNTKSGVIKKKGLKASHGNFSPVLQIRNGKIHFSSSEKLTGEITFTDLRGNVISKAVLNNQDK
ncbi:MAG: hypothetical protein Q4F84_03000, partial [Fibrobacter sp.]|nr:hypothetical protein [Fibrobacter sp.]